MCESKGSAVMYKDTLIDVGLPGTHPQGLTPPP